MTLTSFVSTASVHTRPISTNAETCSFVARPKLCSATRSTRSTLIMKTGTNPDDYKIEQSDYHDPDTEDDSGDGFIGEPDFDDMLGVGMPEDLASFEKKEIQNTRSRDELVDKLKDIKSRRKDIRYDRRKGIGMDNVGNYLDKL